jgi:hypothetical protein
MMFDRWRRDRPVEGAADADGADTVETESCAGPPGADDRGDAVDAADSDAVGGALEAPTSMLLPMGLGRPTASRSEVPGDDREGQIVGLDREAAEASFDVDDVAAFLAGRLVEYRSGRGRRVPAWAVLNPVAHADVGELAGLAGGAGEGREPAWLSGRRSLAAGLLKGRGPREIACIQREVLVPLELWLIERSATATVSARRAVEMAEDVLSVCGCADR